MQPRNDVIWGNDYTSLIIPDIAEIHLVNHETVVDYDDNARSDDIERGGLQIVDVERDEQGYPIKHSDHKGNPKTKLVRRSGTKKSKYVLINPKKHIMYLADDKDLNRNLRSHNLYVDFVNRSVYDTTKNRFGKTSQFVFVKSEPMQ